MLLPSRIPTALRLLLALLATLPAAGCGEDGRQRSLILLTLDTTRADRIGCYGCPDVRTPVLDSWARSGAQAVDAIADVPLTLPSHATMMTGFSALAHGVRTNADFRLSADARTLAEELASRGWNTAAIVSSVVLRAETGIAQGFTHFDDRLASPYVVQDSTIFPPERHWLPDVDRRADETVDRALHWLDGRERGPFFLWVHLYDPHFPYDAPMPWPRVQPDRYLAELEALDAQLRRLRRRLDSRPFDGTALVVTADHGEGLDDHGEDEHGVLVYDEVVRVPLVVCAPGVPVRIVPEQLRTMDLAATALELLDVKPDETLGVGGSLLPALSGAGPAPAPIAYSESIKARLTYSGSQLKAIRRKEAKLVLAPRLELYDLRADPGEKTNLAGLADAAFPSLLPTLHKLVHETVDRRTLLADDPRVDEAAAANLRSLGYAAQVGDANFSTAEEELSLAGFDPKDLIDVVLAGRDLENGFHENAERKLRRFLLTADAAETRPAIRPLWSLARQNLAVIEMARGDFAQAAASYRAALGHERTNVNARWGLVFALNLDRRPGEAEREGARMLEETPAAWRLRFHRAIALAFLARDEEARFELDAMAADAPDADLRKLGELFASRLGTEDAADDLRWYLSWEGKRR